MIGFRRNANSLPSKRHLHTIPHSLDFPKKTEQPLSVRNYLIRRPHAEEDLCPSCSSPLLSRCPPRRRQQALSICKSKIPAVLVFMLKVLSPDQYVAASTAMQRGVVEFEHLPLQPHHGRHPGPPAAERRPRLAHRDQCLPALHPPGWRGVSSALGPRVLRRLQRGQPSADANFPCKHWEHLSILTQSAHFVP